ncbi:response regulator transcription factor [Peterkaempfera bronchialis]|uniref:DNA-binding response regulator n=1 Tax=Peterkaempfera bronchialis TaxID=2126346 RepID=A0A345SUL4_9ACTN|nr:response regulator transcription factor [Peterkaempfera bronchialis]AXI77419.1 DNA-binding response regulator [Peterkaempfera bronchialis]
MRVLVVEDELSLARSLRRGLEAEGWTVDLAHDGRTGLLLAREHPYRVVVLDVMLPVLSGLRVCAELRRAGVTTPVLLLTARDGEWDEAEGLDTGADDYLTKPFSYVVLTARLRALARRAEVRRPLVHEVADLRLDTATRRCHRGEREVPLTAREFAVLQCLARRPGEVVGKDETLDEVWPAGYSGDPNVVEVHVSALRRKIDAPFDRHSLLTVRGVGYRLVADRG